jgi:hypothetical protein
MQAHPERVEARTEISQKQMKSKLKLVWKKRNHKFGSKSQRTEVVVECQKSILKSPWR